MYPLILKPVKKLEKLFIAPKVRQVLYETPQRVFTRCACAQRTGFLIKFFNQESVSEQPGDDAVFVHVDVLRRRDPGQARHGHDAVSYTHLDVYKRQPLRR